MKAQCNQQKSLYRQILGRDWDRLPGSIRVLHEKSEGHAIFRGRAVVERGGSVWARLVASVLGFPGASPDVPVEIHFACRNGREVWTRRFGAKVLRSAQHRIERPNEQWLAEEFGPFRILCALEPTENRLYLSVRAWSFLGLPLPLVLAPGGRTFEEDRDGLFHFHVEVESPLTGMIVRYRGWLRPADEPTSSHTAAPEAETANDFDGRGALIDD
ncbi:DUF4166 domain-containing protein [Ensifer adhaerens]|uniref:DUF4166 domain-containing protein n=1 Tax=Ensifer adhaerens TaxID=106592 RepID=UPI001CBC3F49|nr:DUF4166 domain-containing protein [Ensifer adhaerens]MBZ7920775.1 DUF4166 domain-containing protein [Ensifer adhaerens]UAX93233.1 DUF4166 domain-containing protein [Ensifer adhaerens]UAY00870.1 DUF4166 domain-containing protein [Ensifer adhaerens]UAY08251.1 DUF4166 domain-containing protein [Ensifer adhaerens]